MTTEEIKDLMGNSQWTYHQIDYQTASKLRSALGDSSEYEITESEEGRFIQFENGRFKIINASKDKLTLSDQYGTFDLIRR